MEWVKTKPFSEDYAAAEAICKSNKHLIVEKCKNPVFYKRNGEASADTAPCYVSNFGQCMSDHGWEEREVSGFQCPAMKFF